jgi:hypothetical protein
MICDFFTHSNHCFILIVRVTKVSNLRSAANSWPVWFCFSAWTDPNLSAKSSPDIITLSLGHLLGKFSDWFSFIHIPSGFLAALVNFTQLWILFEFPERDSPLFEEQNILIGAEERRSKRRREKIVWFLFHAKYYSGNQIKISTMCGACYVFSGEDKCIGFLYWKA